MGFFDDDPWFQQQQSGGAAPPGAPPPGGSGLAIPVANPGTNGSNMRYYLGNLQRLPNGNYTDGVYEYDSNGLSLNRPDSAVAGLPPANQSESYNVWQMPSGGGGGGGGGAPGAGGGDAGALTGSPYYQQVLAATNSAAAADAAARRAAIQQALIGFGVVPEGFQDKYGDIDALTRDLAGKNTSSGISTHARMLQARADAIREFSRGLSARGLRRSGAKGYGLRRRQLQFDQGYSDALQKLLGYTGSVYGNFANNEYQRQLGLAGALANASQQIGSYGGAGGGGGGGGGGFRGPAAPDFFAPLAGAGDYLQSAYSPINAGAQGGTSRNQWL